MVPKLALETTDVGAFALKTPVTWILSPGFIFSTRSFSRTTYMDLGNYPVGALSGIS
jgi:hypothetical protein